MVEQTQKMNRDRAVTTVGVRKKSSMEAVEQKAHTGSPVQMFLC